MALKDSTEHSHGRLMACDEIIESQDGVLRLCRIRVWSNRYDPTTWTKESKTGYYFGQIFHENKA